MNKAFLTIVCIGFSFFLQGKELFHFNFRNADGRSKITSGNFILNSEKVPLLVQKGALRVAANAEITITGNIPELKSYTVSAWILKKRDIDVCPILSLGEFGRGQPLVFTAGPEFFARYADLKTSGIRKGNRLKLSGCWKHITAVCNSGICRLYVDGKRYDSANARLILPAGEAVFHGGGEKNGLAPMYYSNADMLLNDLRFEDRALSDDEVSARYAKERKDYPSGNQTPAGASPRHALEECFHYAPRGFDPELKTPLNIHNNYKTEPVLWHEMKAEVRKDRNASPHLLIAGQEYFPYMLYMGKFINHNRLEVEQAAPLARDFASAGVRLCRIALKSWHPYMGALWKEDGVYDFAIADRIIRTALKGNPGALLEITIPTAEPPPWFRKKYPREAEMMMLKNGKLVMANAGGEISSEKWKQATERFTHDLVVWLEKQDYGKQIYGYCVCGGRSSEWYWPGTFTSGVSGYSKITEQGFRNWLKQQYPDRGSLAKAWNQPEVSPEIAKVPLPEERQKSETLLLREPVRAKQVLDYRRFLTDRTTQCQIDLVRAAYKACGGKKIVGLYCGYSFGNAVKHHLSGFNRSRDTMMIPECSYTQLAIVYGSGRQPGQDGFCVNPFNGSNRLHGKLLLYEADLRTPYLLNTVPEEYTNRHKTPEATADVIERNFAVAVTKGDGVYEYLLDGHAMYHDDIIMNAVARCAKAGKEIVKTPRKSIAETAVIFDEPSMLYFAWPNGENNRYFRTLLEDFNHNSPRAGFPMDFYFAEDLKNPAMPDYKFYIFLNQIEYRQETADAIRKKLEKNNASSLWCMLPGILDKEKFSASSMEKMTGFTFGLSMEKRRLSPIPESGSKLFRKGDKLSSFLCGPIAIPSGKGLAVHATSDGKAVIAEKQIGNRRVFYSMIPPDAMMLRRFATYAGVHIWLDSRDVFSANSTHLLVHASSTGKKHIHLPFKADVYDAFTGKELFRNVSDFSLPLKFGKNLFLRFKKHP